MPAAKSYEGDYHPPYQWQANGDLSLYPLSVAGALNGQVLTAVGAAAGQGSFDGFRKAFVGMLIDSSALATAGGQSKGITLVQRVAGASGTTTVELYRYRASVGTWVLVISASITAASGNGFAQITDVPANFQLDPDDLLVVVLTAVETGTPEDLTVIVGFT